MNTALIFAGGAGTRMNSRSKPKQFLELYGKPIIAYTLEQFQYHPLIEKICVVSIESGINDIRRLIHRYELSKVEQVVPGGNSGFESILHGLRALEPICIESDLVLIHDGVRPLIDEMMISNCIRVANEHGNAISCVPVNEGIIISNDGKLVGDFPDRKLLYATKAPQVFKYKMIYDLYKRAEHEGLTPIESAHLCQQYGVELHMVESSHSNIKITTATDFYIFRAIHEAVENSQIIGF